MNKKAQKWIRDFGPRKVRAAFPKEIAVTDSAVYGWLRGRARPSYERAKSLVEMAKKDNFNGGKQLCLTIDDFLAPYEELDRTTTTTGKNTNG
jgi:hypothetical protein